MSGAPDVDEVAPLSAGEQRRSSSTNAMRLIGLGRRASSTGVGTGSALKYVGLGKRPNAIRYIGLGKRAPDRSAAACDRP